MNLTLDEAWRLCTWQWDDLAEEIKAGSTVDVGTLKAKWYEKHGYDDVRSNCFFCEYAWQHAAPKACVCHCCPGRLVDEDFNCQGREYDYFGNPLAFHKTLTELNQIRLSET